MPYITPAAATTTIFVGAGEFNNVQGSTSFNNFDQNWTVYRYDATNQETAAASVYVPASWNTAAATLFYVGDGAGGGDILWRLEHHTMVPGSGDNTADAADETNDVTPTLAAGDDSDLLSASLGTVTFAGSGSLSSLVLLRRANQAGDTFAGEAGLVGILLTKTS